jgi:hypothetical protein
MIVECPTLELISCLSSEPSIARPPAGPEIFGDPIFFHKLCQAVNRFTARLHGPV